jgi:hypothetical protein
VAIELASTEVFMILVAPAKFRNELPNLDRLKVGRAPNRMLAPRTKALLLRAKMPEALHMRRKLCTRLTVGVRRIAIDVQI